MEDHPDPRAESRGEPNTQRTLLSKMVQTRAAANADMLLMCKLAQVRAVETARLAERVGTAHSAATTQQQSLQHLLEARDKAQAELDEVNRRNAAAEHMVSGIRAMCGLVWACHQQAGTHDTQVSCLMVCHTSTATMDLIFIPLLRCHKIGLKHCAPVYGQVHELLLELAGARQQVAARRLSDMAEFRAVMDDRAWRDLLQQVSTHS